MKSSRPAEIVLVMSFLAMLAVPALVQTAIDLRRDGSVQALAVFHQRPTSANLRAYEDELKDASWLGKQLRPWIQFALFSWFQDGGEKALVGRDGWLFYKPGFRYLTERAVMPAHGSATSPQAAIVNFRDQLATRGVRLLVVVAPNKESIYPDMLSHRARSTDALISPQTRQLLSDLSSAGVEVVDLWEVYGAFKQDPANSHAEPLYLTQDSHWSPAGVELAARSVAQDPGSRLGDRRNNGLCKSTGTDREDGRSGADAPGSADRAAHDARRRSLSPGRATRHANTEALRR